MNTVRSRRPQITKLQITKLQNSMNGVLVIDKPSGLTSHDVVNRVRRILGQRAVALHPDRKLPQKDHHVQHDQKIIDERRRESGLIVTKRNHLIGNL